MTRFLAVFLAALLLIQTFSRELVMLDYQVRKERITELFCVNKAKPELHCNGKCHLAKQLRKTTDPASKAPVAGFSKVKYEVVLPFVFRLAAPELGGLVRPCYAPAVCARYAVVALRGVFHPPAFQV